MIGYLGKIWVFVDDRLEQLHSVLTAEWRKTSDHFVQKTAQAPPIHIHSMPHLLHDLRSEVLGSSADGVSSLFILQDLRQSKVGEFDVPYSIDDDIFWLEAVYFWKYSRYITFCLCSASRASTICEQ